MQIPLKPGQKCLRMAGAAPWLVFVQHDWPVGVPAGAVQPHITLALGCFARFMEHLQGRFVRVENLPLQQFLVKQLIDRRQQMFRTPQQPVGHGLP